MIPISMQIAFQRALSIHAPIHNPIRMAIDIPITKSLTCTNTGNHCCSVHHCHSLVTKGLVQQPFLLPIANHSWNSRLTTGRGMLAYDKETVEYDSPKGSFIPMTWLLRWSNNHQC